jgi:hypothetical protein
VTICCWRRYCWPAVDDEAARLAERASARSACPAVAERGQAATCAAMVLRPARTGRCLSRRAGESVWPHPNSGFGLRGVLEALTNSWRRGRIYGRPDDRLQYRTVLRCSINRCVTRASTSDYLQPSAKGCYGAKYALGDRPLLAECSLSRRAAFDPKVCRTPPQFLILVLKDHLGKAYSS